MKYQIMLGIFFTLLNNRKATATELAEKFSCSVRSIYRYVDEMTVAGVPIDLMQGARGGIRISDSYKLPKGLMTREEYDKTLDALLAFRGQLPDSALDSAIAKLTSALKDEKFDLSLSGSILVDSGGWGGAGKFSEKLALAESAIEEKQYLEINYVDRGGEQSRRKIKPLLLVYKQNIWYLYAFCTLRGDFRLFKIGRIRSVLRTGETFEPVAFSRESIPLSFWKNENALDARFEISPEALPLAEEWLGVENILTDRDGRLFAEVTLPDDESLAGKILSMGTGFRVVFPQSLCDRVREEAQKIAAAYA